jgi:hypothetical protein
MSKVSFEVFRGVLASYESLFRKAAAFASTIDQDKLVSISHSSNGAEGIVTVWYRR